MKETPVHSEYGFRSRALQSYNPDNEGPSCNKRRKKRAVKVSKPTKASKSKSTLIVMEEESSSDKQTILTTHSFDQQMRDK